MMKLNFRILGVVFLVSFALFFFDTDVYADSLSKTDALNNWEDYDEYMSSNCLASKIVKGYKVGTSIVESNDKKYLKVSITGSKAAVTEKFKIIDISGLNVVGGYNDVTIKGGKSKKLEISNISGNVSYTVTVRMVATGSKKLAICLGRNGGSDNKYLEAAQKWEDDGYLILTSSMTSPGLTSHSYSIYDTSPIYKYLAKKSDKDDYNGRMNQITMINNEIASYKNNSTTGSLESKRTSAMNDIWNHLTSSQRSGNSTTSPDTLECDVNKTQSTNGDYYVNKNYFYKKQKKEKITVQYTNKSNPVTVCQPTCEEFVKVEYGPPVASKAGLCFEYKVKVTSHVNCSSGELKNSPDPNDYTSCTPYSYCNNGTQKYKRQAGPTQDFDMCIQECDGGKYSRKCSVSCYKEIYGNNLAFNSNFSLENTTKKTDSSCKDVDGCYYEDDDGGIHWKSKNFANGTLLNDYYSYDNKASGKDLANRGRWYVEGDYDPILAGTGSAYYVDKGGFFRAVYASGSVCGDSCYWDGCDDSKYLNLEQAKQDYIDDAAAWVKEATNCIEKASCSDSQAEFSISVDYLEGNQRTTKKFPLADSSAKLPTKKHSTVNDNPDDIIMDWGGCYKENEGEDYYMTEWSFPGTWINNKTGEISYQDKPGDTWHQEKDKFCLPLNAKSMNTQWWEWNQLGNNCYSDSNGKYNGKDIDRNIKASTKNFGYFGWNLNISCFYAIRNETCDLNNEGCCGESTSVPGDPNGPGGPGGCSGTSCGTTLNYSFRNIDTSNMFPAANGSNISNANETGRLPGFNWSDKATDLSNSNYKIDPESLISSIQKRETSVDDKYLEYRFKLDKITLQKIRDFTNSDNKNNGDHTAFSGSTELKNGIYFYNSPLINSTYGAVNTTNNNRYNNYGFYGR